jgi:hypothetical protein
LKITKEDTWTLATLRGQFLTGLQDQQDGINLSRIDQILLQPLPLEEVSNPSAACSSVSGCKNNTR